MSYEQIGVRAGDTNPVSLLGGGKKSLSKSCENLNLAPFQTHRAAALALLNSGTRLTRKAGSFLGQCCVDATPLTEAQTGWLETLLERAGLPPINIAEAVR